MPALFLRPPTLYQWQLREMFLQQLQAVLFSASLVCFGFLLSFVLVSERLVLRCLKCSYGFILLIKFLGFYKLELLFLSLLVFSMTHNRPCTWTEANSTSVSDPLNYHYWSLRPCIGDIGIEGVFSVLRLRTFTGVSLILKCSFM